MDGLEYWDLIEGKYWVVEIFARDTLPNGTYRVVRKVHKAFVSKKDASADATSLSAQLSVEVRHRTGVTYQVWSDRQLSRAAEWGTEVVA